MRVAPQIRLLILAALAACGTAVAPKLTPSASMRSGGTSLSMLGVGAGVPMRVQSARRDGAVAEVGELVGAWLDTGDGGRWLMPGPWRAEGDVLTARCDGPPDHDIHLSLRLRADGDLEVTVEDRIGVRVQIAGLGVGWRLRTREPLDEASIPLLHPGEHDVAGDAAFRAPIAYARSGEHALAILPDLGVLAGARRLPQSLTLEQSQGGPILLHAVSAQVPRVDVAATRIAADPAAAVQVRNEVLRVRHRLHAESEAVAGATLAALRSALWAEHVEARLRRSALPFETETFESTADAALDARIARDLRTGRRGNVAVAYLSEPGPAGTETAQLGAVRNQLFEALALARRAARGPAGDGALRQTALELARFALQAPRRGGMVPHSFRVETATGTETWSPGDPEGPRAELLCGADAATTAVLLLELAELLPELAAPAHALSTELARFFVHGQRRDGAIPALYEPRHLAAVPLDEDDLPGTTAAPAWLLARHAVAVDDAEVRRAATAAVHFVAQRIVLDDAPVADPSLARSPLRDPRSGDGVRDLLPLAAAAQAAILLAADDPSLRPDVDVLLDALTELQQVWTPPWLDGRLLGGFGRSNADTVWSAAGQHLAAKAFLDGYELSGRREWLERGAVGLRASFAQATPVSAIGRWPSGRDAIAAAAAAAATVEDCRARFGQAVIDTDGGFMVGLDGAWFESPELDPAIAFRLHTYAADLGLVELRIRGSGRSADRIIVDGLTIARGPVRSVMVRPKLDSQLLFRPPARIQEGAPWSPTAAYRGPVPDGELYVEIAKDGQVLQKVPLLPAGEGRLRAVEPGFVPSGLVDGDRLSARLILHQGARLRTVPAVGARELTVGPMACIDPGDDLEDRLVGSSEGVRTARFVTGSENARVAPPGESFAYSLRIPRDAAAVEARLLVSGAVEIFDARSERVLHADPDDVPAGDRTLSLRFADPRLWPNGELVLRFRASSDGPAAIARIEYQSSGVAMRLDADGQMRTSASPDARIEVVVVPVGTRGNAAPAPEVLAQAFAGDTDYRMTPAPERRATIGSAAQLVSVLSGGRTAFAARVRSPLRFEGSVDDLREARGALALERLLEADVERLFGARGGSVDAVVVVINGLTADSHAELSVGGRPLILLPEREPDGSYLSCGRIVRELLVRRYGLERLARPEMGAFGILALSSTQALHTPAAPAGINLIRTGWADMLDLDPEQAEVRLPPLVQGRTMLRLPAGDLPGAPDLLFETHRDPTVVSGPPRGGLLVYRSFTAEEAPTLCTLDGAMLRPRYWRVSPLVSSLRTPFEPATWSDLFRDTFRLDDASPPSLTTPRGETPWIVARISMLEGPTAELTVRSQVVDLLATSERGWRAGIGDALGTIPETGLDTGVASVESSPRGPAFALADRDGARLQAVLLDPGADLPRRLFGEIADFVGGEAELRVVRAGTTLLRTALRNGDNPFVVELPSGRDPAELWIECVRIAGRPRAVLANLRTVPRSAGAVAAELSGLPLGTARLADGTIHAGTRLLRLDGRGHASLRVPILPPSSRGVLRLVAGTTAAAGPLTLRLSLRSVDGEGPRSLGGALQVGGEDHVPLTVALCELPESPNRQLAFVELDVRGAAGAVLHIIALETDRL